MKQLQGHNYGAVRQHSTKLLENITNAIDVCPLYLLHFVTVNHDV
jgi:hypothetical protein